MSPQPQGTARVSHTRSGLSVILDRPLDQLLGSPVLLWMRRPRRVSSSAGGATTHHIEIAIRLRRPGEHIAEDYIRVVPDRRPTQSTIALRLRRRVGEPQGPLPLFPPAEARWAHIPEEHLVIVTTPEPEASPSSPTGRLPQPRRNYILQSAALHRRSPEPQLPTNVDYGALEQRVLAHWLRQLPTRTLLEELLRREGE